MKNKLRKFVNYINSINFEVLLGLILITLYVVNCLIIWIGPFFLDTHSDFYLTNVCLGMAWFFGFATAFFPVLVIYFLWEALTLWVNK